jgi:hypothetical protein
MTITFTRGSDYSVLGFKLCSSTEKRRCFASKTAIRKFSIRDNGSDPTKVRLIEWQLPKLRSVNRVLFTQTHDPKRLRHGPAEGGRVFKLQFGKMRVVLWTAQDRIQVDIV